MLFGFILSSGTLFPSGGTGCTDPGGPPGFDGNGSVGPSDLLSRLVQSDTYPSGLPDV